MNEKDKERTEKIKDVLCEFIINVATQKNETTSTVEVQALAEVVKAFCDVVKLSNFVSCSL